MLESESHLGSIKKKCTAVHPNRLQLQAWFLAFAQVAGLLFAQPRDAPFALVHAVLGLPSKFRPPQPDLKKPRHHVDEHLPADRAAS